MKKKLKLTKLTVANLNRIKGGKPKCYCDFVLNNGQYNQNYWTAPIRTLCIPTCVGEI